MGSLPTVLIKSIGQANFESCNWMRRSSRTCKLLLIGPQGFFLCLCTAGLVFLFRDFSDPCKTNSMLNLTHDHSKWFQRQPAGFEPLAFRGTDRHSEANSMFTKSKF